MAELQYPQHFLHDIDRMTPAERANRCDELVAWAKRYAGGNANPKWVTAHMYELSRLVEMMRNKPIKNLSI